MENKAVLVRLIMERKGFYLTGSKRWALRMKLASRKCKTYLIIKEIFIMWCISQSRDWSVMLKKVSWKTVLKKLESVALKIWLAMCLNKSERYWYM